MEWKNSASESPYLFKDLARDSGIVSTYLSNIMTGARTPGLKTVEKIAEAFGKSISEFYSGPSGYEPSFGNEQVSEINKDYIEPASVKKHDVEFPEMLKAPSSSKLVSVEKFGLKISGERKDNLFNLFDTFIQSPDLMPDKKSMPAQEPQISPDNIPQDKKGSFTSRVPYIPVINSPLPGHWSEWNFKDPVLQCLPRYYGIEGREIFAYIMNDSSMCPEIFPGDVLIVNPSQPFTNFSGGICLAAIAESFIVRKVYLNDGMINLIPANPEFKKLSFPEESASLYKISLWIPSVEKRF